MVKNNVEISTIQNDQTDNGVINKNNVEISTVESNGNVVADNNVQHKIDQVVASHHDKSYTSDEFENYLKTKQDAPTKEEIQAGFGNAKYGEDMYGKKIEDMDSYQKFVKYMGREELLKS